MSPETSPVMEKIIAATIECLNQDGLDGLTIRGIAAKAGVNIAAVNYYFGSKDNLVQKALARAMKEMSDMPGEILGDENLEPRDRVRILFESLIEGILLYPGLIRAEIYAPLIQDRTDAPFLTGFQSFLSEVVQRIEALGLEPRTGDLPGTVVQAASAVLFSAMMPRLTLEVAGIDLIDPQSRRSFVLDLIARFFK